MVVWAGIVFTVVEEPGDVVVGASHVVEVICVVVVDVVETAAIDVVEPKVVVV